MARVGKYVVTGEIGRGFSGAIVSSALDPVIGRQVAVKTAAKADDNAVRELQHEAQAAGALHHTHVASIFEYGEDAQQAWIAMEMVRGKTLASHMEAGYRAPSDPPAQIVLQLLEALEYAHGRGILHGDLRAENVLIDESGTVKLIGFGGQGTEQADVHALVALLKNLFAEPVAALDASHSSMRTLLDALKPKAKAGGGGMADKLRRAIKSTQAEAPAPAAPARKLPAVLFVDDEERVLNALAGLFRGRYEVDTAPGGAAALEKLRERKYLVLCSDQRMPEMLGAELLREAKTLAPTTVRLLLTGYSDLGAIMASVNEGEIFRFINKPWEQADLEATLAEAVDVAIALEAAAASGRGAARVAGTVLVASADAALARGARELAGGGLKVLEAADTPATLDTLAREEVAVLVAELDPRSEDPAALLRVLKEASPQTQLVAIAQDADSELAIGLVNEARVHRFLTRPVSLPILHQAVVSALERHAQPRAAPGLARMETARKKAETKSTITLRERMNALGGRFRNLIGSAAR